MKCTVQPYTIFEFETEETNHLKELGLTEGYATGLPAIRKAMQQNGSPEAIFDFDEERTWFQVTLPIHHAFRKKTPYTADLGKIEWNLHGIDNLLNQIIEYAEVDVSGIAGSKGDTHAGTIVDKL